MPRENFTKINEEYFYTILDEDFSFKGIIKFKDSSIIKGYIKGIIESQSDLIIGPNAVIDADISAKALECFGRINGNVTVNGTLTATTDVVGGGKSLNSHTHGGVTPGGGNTGTPN